MKRCASTCLVLGLWLFASDSQARAQQAVYSADSKLLATAVGKGGVVVLWEVPSGKQLQMLKGQSGPIFFMTFSPDGKLLATVDQNAKSARLWDTTAGTALPELGDKKQRVERVVIAPDSKSFFLVSDTASGVLWPSAERDAKPVTLKLTSSDKAPNAYRAGVEYSPDGKTLATRAWDGTLKLWNAHTGQEQATLEPAGIKKVKFPPSLFTPKLSFSPDGKSLIAQGAGPFPTVSLWDVATAAETLSGQSLQVRALLDMTFSQDGKSQALCVATAKGVSLVLRDPASGKQRNLADLGLVDLDMKEDKELVVVKSVKLEFSPDGKLLLASIKVTGESFVKIWDLGSDKLLATVDGFDPQLTPDGTGVVARRSGGVKVYDFRDNSVRQAVLERQMVIAPDGRTFFSMTSDATMSLWDTGKDGKRTKLTLEKDGK
jgi:WD40 repeat protein